MKQNHLEKSFVAQYRRIENDLRNKIHSGRWNAGAMLPSRRDLAREYQVSSVTIGRAVDKLITEGLLNADSRRGTFIAHDTPPPGTGVARLSGAVAEASGGAPEDRAERPARPQSVGIVGALDNEQSSQILHSLEHALSEAGHVTSVCNRSQSPDGPLLPLETAIEALLQEGVDALAVICLELDRGRIEEALGRIDLQDTPTVGVLAGELHLPIPHVFYDNRIGGYQAAKHLIDKGHRQITVFAPFSASWVSERIAGIRHALSHSRTAHELQILMGDGKPWDYLSDPTLYGRRTAEAALESGWRAQGGVICISDQVAHGVCCAAQDYGYRPGVEFAVIGFDDEKCARADGLTTLRPPLEAMGREAARLLIAESQGSRVNLQVRLRAHLIARASTNFVPTAEAACR